MELQYLNILAELVEKGERTENRTGIDTFKLPPRMIQHDMADGFPILTTKRVAWKTLRVELEGFIKGITSKKWYQDRGCHIWDEWCNPQKVAYGHDEEIRAKMKAEDDLGPCIYGASWRNFHDPYALAWDSDDEAEEDGEYFVGQNVDQLAKIINTLKTNPTDRRMICLAWNPLGLEHTALPACHVLWQVTTRGDKLDMTFYMRSVDVFLGAPFNIASYGLLLHLLAKETGFKEGYLTGFLSDVHLYENHLDQAREQLSRAPRVLPRIESRQFARLFDWDHKFSRLIGYDPHPAIKAPIAI